MFEEFVEVVSLGVIGGEEFRGGLVVVLCVFLVVSGGSVGVGLDLDLNLGNVMALLLFLDILDELFCEWLEFFFVTRGFLVELVEDILLNLIIFLSDKVLLVLLEEEVLEILGLENDGVDLDLFEHSVPLDEAVDIVLEFLLLLLLLLHRDDVETEVGVLPLWGSLEEVDHEDHEPLLVGEAVDIDIALVDELLIGEGLIRLGDEDGLSEDDGVLHGFEELLGDLWAFAVLLRESEDDDVRLESSESGALDEELGSLDEVLGLDDLREEAVLVLVEEILENLLLLLDLLEILELELRLVGMTDNGEAGVLEELSHQIEGSLWLDYAV